MNDDVVLCKSLTYDDVSLIADYFDGESRSDLDTSVTLGKQTFNMPVIPANMKCCIDFKLAELLSYNNYFYVLHRFYEYDEIKKWISDNQSLRTISISLGVQQKDFDFIDWYVESGLRIDYITLDIAHGHCKRMKHMLNHIKVQTVDAYVPHIIAGNVMTTDAVEDLVRWGADTIKVGIGPGAACTTKLKTGFHSPMFTTVQNCVPDYTYTRDHISLNDEVMDEVNNCEIKLSFDEKTFAPIIECNLDYLKIINSESYNAIGPEYQRDYIKRVGTRQTFYIDIQSIRDEAKRRHEKCKIKPSIIADGGIRHNGDVAKALVAGADMVMVGSLFTACIDSPAESIHDWGEYDQKLNFNMNMHRLYDGMSDESKSKVVKPEDPSKITAKITHKRYFGSASATNKGHNVNVEGKEIDIECNGLTYLEKISEMKQDLQSSISYSGGSSINDLQWVKYNII